MFETQKQTACGTAWLCNRKTCSRKEFDIDDYMEGFQGSSALAVYTGFSQLNFDIMMGN